MVVRLGRYVLRVNLSMGHEDERSPARQYVKQLLIKHNNDHLDDIDT